MPKLNTCSKVVNILDLLDLYDLFLFDLWGVIIQGPGLYPRAKILLDEICMKKKVMFISNTSGSKESTCNKLSSLGLNVGQDMIITSGELTKDMLRNPGQYFNVNKPNIYNFGLQGNAELWQKLGLPTTDNLHEAGVMVISLCMVKEAIEPAIYDTLKRAAELNIPAICANNDRVWHEGGKVIYCAGHFAEKYESFGGKVYYIGKPFEPIFLQALKNYPQISKERVLMIGDTPETDVLGANKVGISSALVTTGNMLALLQDASDSDEVAVLQKINFEIQKLKLQLNHITRL